MKEKFEEACALLRAVLCESGVENDFDPQIYLFLAENNQLPDNYDPYWE